MYAGAPLALGAFRRQVPEADRPYRLPGAAVIAPLSFIIANMLIYWSGFEVIWKLGIVLVIGYVLIGIFMAFDKQRPPLKWKAAVWLIGMGVISWQGQYSGRRGQGAGQHGQPAILVGHAGRRGIRPHHLLLGTGVPAAQGRDDGTRLPAGGVTAGTGQELTQLARCSAS